jgi:hypothetical protein
MKSLRILKNSNHLIETIKQKMIFFQSLTLYVKAYVCILNTTYLNFLIFSYMKL